MLATSNAVTSPRRARKKKVAKVVDSSSDDEEAPPKVRRRSRQMERRPLQKGSYLDLPASGRRLVLGDQLGKGVYGEVYKVSVEGSSSYEKLCLKIQVYNRDNRTQIQEEIKVMDVIKSNPAAAVHLMTHIAPITVPGYLCLLMPEFGCSLLNILSRKTGPFELSLIQEIGYQIMSGLQYLHALGYVHCDIKPSNILVKTENDVIAVMVADMGNATPIKMMNKWRYENCVHATWYRPPEVYLGMIQDHKSDIWASACILAEMYTGDALFVTEEHCHHLARLRYSLFPTDMSRDLKKLKLYRQHFYLTGIPYNANLEGRHFTKFFTLDRITRAYRPYSSEELLLQGIIYRSRSAAREYGYLEQMIQYGKNKIATPMDNAFIATLKTMLHPNIRERPDAQTTLRTPFFYALMMKRVYGQVII